MELALILGKQLLSMFIMIAVGYLLVKIGLLKAEDSRPLSILIIYVISPCMIFASFQQKFRPEILQGLLMCTICAAAIHLLFYLVGHGLKKPLGLNTVDRASIMYVNAGNLIIPLVAASLGDEWVVYTTAYVLIFLPLMWGHGYSILSGQNSVKIGKVLTNPNIIGIALGLLFFVLGWRLPEVLGNTVNSFGGLIAPINMLMLGVMMAGADMKKLFSIKRAYVVCFIRLILCPVLAILLIKVTGFANLFPDGKSVLLVSVLAASAPSGSNVVQVAQLFDRDADYAATINILTCLFCAVTIPLMTWFYQWIV
ncbi:MAG: AEC family transporter [Clostridia bacterium]|nr:AEC family transporter [Clostridia bacterium]